MQTGFCIADGGAAPWKTIHAFIALKTNFAVSVKCSDPDLTAYYIVVEEALLFQGFNTLRTGKRIGRNVQFNSLKNTFTEVVCQDSANKPLYFFSFQEDFYKSIEPAKMLCWHGNVL